jgi:hypothetical protein
VITRVRIARGTFATYTPARYGIRLAPPPLGGHVVPATVLVVRGKVDNLRLRVVSTA